MGCPLLFFVIEKNCFWFPLNLGRKLIKKSIHEFKRETCESAYANLESQIKDYDKLTMDYEESVRLCEVQIKIKEDMIKTIKPKWYENKYLWFFGGVFFTSGTVYLAGQLD